jgi:hypothetical protein
LAHVLVAKYADHLPLYRQSAIYAREGVELERSTLADWVGGTSALLSPLVEALAKETLSAGKLHTDDTPVPVLAPGHGKTKTGRLWVYARDDRPAGDGTAPAVLFRYSADRKGERPREHLQAFKGFLQADGYAGYNKLYGKAYAGCRTMRGWSSKCSAWSLRSSSRRCGSSGPSRATSWWGQSCSRNSSGGKGSRHGRRFQWAIGGQT